MQRTVGVLVDHRVAAGLVVEHRLSGPVLAYPDPDAGPETPPIASLPSEEIIEIICQRVRQLTQGEPAQAIGVGFPGIIRDGVVEESPNLKQAKGCRLKDLLNTALNVPVLVLNDADAMAAGIAATAGRLESVIRAWTIGDGIGYGRYPHSEGVWEGGHMVVSLDPKERYCGCGGTGHLEGIMGHAAMRHRFLDMEPEEVFAAAQTGDARCAAFVKLWHQALAAATATSVHLEGPGKFFISGYNANLVQVPLLSDYLHDMVKMSSLQGTMFEVVATSEETAIVGAAVNAGRSLYSL